jgi:hypothetical protein
LVTLAENPGRALAELVVSALDAFEEPLAATARATSASARRLRGIAAP